MGITVTGMFEGRYRQIVDQCPGCGQVFEGRRYAVEGRTVYHKGRCAAYKSWYQINGR